MGRIEDFEYAYPLLDYKTKKGIAMRHAERPKDTEDMLTFLARDIDAINKLFSVGVKISYREACRDLCKRR